MFIFRTFVRATLTALLAAAILQVSTAHAAPATSTGFPEYFLKPGRLVDIGGYRLNMYCMGSGSPTVVMDSGLGWGAYAWALVQAPIAKFTRVCTYDRAGYGFSDMGPLPRTSEQISLELKLMLDRAKIAPPYVLVGWSFGGMNVRSFADRYRRDVAGLVLVDPSHEDMGQYYPQSWLAGAKQGEDVLQKCGNAAKAGSLKPGSSAWDGCIPYVSNPELPPSLRRSLDSLAQRPANYFTQLSEFTNLFTVSSQQLRDTRCFYGSMPLEILHAAKQPDDPAAQEFDRHYIGLIETVADYSARGELLIVTRAGHDIQIDRPQIVIDSVRHVVDDARLPRRGSNEPASSSLKTCPE